MWSTVTRTGGSLAVILVVFAGCASGSGGSTRPVYRGPPSPPGYRLQGRIVDAETGETIALDLLDVRFWPDEGSSVMLGMRATTYYFDGPPHVRAEGGERFDVRLPFHDVRVAVNDPRKKYFPYEETLRVPATGLEHVVRLRPTNRVLLKGRAIDARTGEPTRPDRASAFSEVGDDGEGSVSVNPDDRGFFEVYVPRSVVLFEYFTPMTGPTVGPTLDLRGVEGEVAERTISFALSRPGVPPPAVPDGSRESPRPLAGGDVEVGVLSWTREGVHNAPTGGTETKGRRRPWT